MVHFTPRSTLAGAAIAAALSLSGCSAPAAAPEPAGSGAPPATVAAPGSAPASPAASGPAATPESPAASGAATKGSGPETVPYAPPEGDFDSSDPAAVQAELAKNFITELVTNRYSLSGQWVEDGGGHAGTAKLWETRLSANLKAKLTAAGKDADVSGFGAWAVFALPGTGSTEPVKASPACAAATEPHCLLLQEIEGEVGAMKQAGGPQPGSLDQTVANRVAFNYDVAVPVSLTAKGDAEGVLRGVLKVDLTYVPNPDPAAGGPAFLIDAIRNDLTGTRTEELAASPGLMFESY